MPAAKPLSKEDILRAMRFTKSNRAAAKYLGCSYQHYKPYAKLHKDEETGLKILLKQVLVGNHLHLKKLKQD
jgi:molybdenum-dependent DNA-binding transcriptional regulator ModE